MTQTFNQGGSCDTYYNPIFYGEYNGIRPPPGPMRVKGYHLYIQQVI